MRTYLRGTRHISAHAMACALLALTAQPALAQESRVSGGSASSALLGEIVVTGTKQGAAELNQKVPVTISAFNSEQIENLRLNNVQNLAYSIPNVSFESPGSTKGTANLTIRGLGLNSSVSSSAPTVGVFVNGMYLGVNQGVLLDTFDLEAIEVLRGPQGTLFGRNVTGGAVLLNNAKPRQEMDFKARFRLESGPDYSIAVAGGGGITDTLSGRLAVLYRDDQGYFENVTLNDKHYGADENIVIRPSLRWQPGTATDITLFGEYGKQTGDGPLTIAPDYRGGTVTTPGNGPRQGMEYPYVYENFRGTTDQEYYNLVLDATQNVGDTGVITSVTGYRKLEAYSEYASDGTPLTVSHNGGWLEQEQFSQELRYNGTFGRLNLTVGGYFFHQKQEQLNKQFVINATQAGELTENVFGAFGQIDYEIIDNLTLQVGGRLNYEKKKANVASLASDDPNVNQPGTFGIPGQCNFDTLTCTYQYTDLKDSWTNFSPKVSIKYEFTPTIQAYASAQKAFRSGGFNVRYNAASLPLPYGPEKQDAFEIGFKSDLFDGKTRLNGAAFYTKIHDLQRDITVFDNITLANVTRTLNTADATTKGFEVEYVQQIIPGVVFNANVGYVHAKYDNILYDITQDPPGNAVVDDLDYQQKLPRVSPWTYNAGLTADHEFAIGRATLQLNYSHRDASFFPDYNTNRRDGAVPKLPAVDLFDAQITFEPANTGMSISFYGKNLTNEYSLSAFTPIVYPTLNGCSCLPNKGRILGAELAFKF